LRKPLCAGALLQLLDSVLQPAAGRLPGTRLH
jgi:hypothetical protein